MTNEPTIIEIGRNEAGALETWLELDDAGQWWCCENGDRVDVPPPTQDEIDRWIADGHTS